MTKIQQSPYADLKSMMRTCRPHRSATERKFIQRWIDPLGVKCDKRGNRIKQIGDSPILWSCHTDTAHRRSGNQKIKIAAGTMALGENIAKPGCLGADNTVGVWLLREMALAGIPGLYIFHRGEERGGIGSRHIAYSTPELVDGIKCAIAFDRRGCNSVITHQIFRTCSDAFATSLAKALDLDLKPDDTGLFTDTASYKRLIGECTNVSAGFYGEHGENEYLDVDYLFALRDQVLGLNPDDLVYARRPGEIDLWDDPYLDDSEADLYDIFDPYGVGSSTATVPTTMIAMIRRNPEEVADFLIESGLSRDDLREEILCRGGAA